MRFTLPETLITAIVVVLLLVLVAGFTVGLARGDTTPHWSYSPGDDPVAFDSKTGRACRVRPGMIVCVDYQNNRVTRSPIAGAGSPFDSLASRP